MEIQDFIWKNVMKINWFKKDWLKYVRDDWIEINFTAWMHNIVFWDWTVIYCETKRECMWDLVLRNIINRLF